MKTTDFYKQFPTQRFKKGELVLVEGEVPKCAYVVKSGVIKGHSITTEGLERPIAFDTKNEIFPVGWVFKKLRWSQYCYTAFTDAELYRIPREDYLDYLRQHPEDMFEAYERFVGHYLNLQMRVNALEQSKAVDKILHTLHFLALRHGREIGPHKVEIQLPLTQQELANIIGLTRETTGIELKKLERKGVLTHRRHTYTILTNKLNEVLDEEYDPEILVD